MHERKPLLALSLEVTGERRAVGVQRARVTSRVEAPEQGAEVETAADGIVAAPRAAGADLRYPEALQEWLAQTEDICESGEVPTDSLGGVGLLDVLEHLDDDVAAFRTAVARYLRPGGAVVVTVPAHAWLWSRVDEVSGHRRRYARHDLVRAMAAAGPRVESCRPFFVLRVPGLLVRRAAPGADADALLRSALAPSPPINAVVRAVEACRLQLTIGTSWLAVERKTGDP